MTIERRNGSAVNSWPGARTAGATAEWWVMTTLAIGPADSSAEPDALYSAFSSWVDAQGITLYPAQDEAVVELVTGANVVLATPTGSGKSLVAGAAPYFALAAGGRSGFTGPTKGLGGG